jgi:hypothetical protein
VISDVVEAMPVARLLRSSHESFPIVISSSVRVIGKGYFPRLQSVIFEDNSHLSEIAERAFSSTEVEIIVLPSSLEIIGRSAFALCSKLSNVAFEDDSKLKRIEERAFSSTALTEMHIPAAV